MRVLCVLKCSKLKKYKNMKLTSLRRLIQDSNNDIVAPLEQKKKCVLTKQILTSWNLSDVSEKKCVSCSWQSFFFAFPPYQYHLTLCSTGQRILQFQSRNTNIITLSKVVELVSNWITGLTNRNRFHHTTIGQLATNEFPIMQELTIISIISKMVRLESECF